MENELNVCRTCLASSVKLYKLEEPFMRPIGNYDVQKEMKVSFAECLDFCTRLNNVPGFPNFICDECSQALQIAYVFIKNSLKAHEILTQRLGSDIKQELNHEKPTDEMTVIRFRCKICNEKVETKKALKEHIKLHLDVITYCCQMCDFDCKKRSKLSDHYRNEHNVEASADQLKPYMQTNMESNAEEVKNETDEIDEIFAPSEQRLREQEEAERLLQELEEKLSKEKEMEEQNKKSLLVKREETPSDTILVNSMDLENNEFTTISTADISQNFENDVSVGSEFVVMPDGTVQKVDGADVVIEYINQDANGDANVESNNIVVENQVPMDTTDVSFDTMDFEDIIEEAPDDLQNAVSSIMPNFKQEESQTKKVAPRLHCSQPQVKSRNLGTTSKKIQCKICKHVFQTQSNLKTHMLEHQEIPHFFCDQCSFYTFFRNDLTQHYRTKHNLQPSPRQLQPINKSEASMVGRAVYSCDLCLYETPMQMHLRRHYVNEHSVQATEVQLRPTIDNTDVQIKSCSNIRKGTVVKRDLLDNLRCNICNIRFTTSNKLKEHMGWHEKQDMKNEVKTQETQENLQMEPMTTNSLELSNNNINSYTILPMDAVPQVVASEETVNFDFNGDEIFEDFDENDESNCDGQDDDDLGDLFLTSEDDLDDLLEEHGNDDKTSGKTKPAPQLRAYCVHCNKRFFSQYHFENHMFIHRGLAPFRCEMCTNLYNTKRAIIRHYKAVHKTIPTRDMIQARGDKMNVDKTPVESLNMEGAKRCTLMCAKCPFESKSNDSNNLNELLLHLSSIHGITDDNYILQKLPFECPRCIRSYDSKESLMRHLERSHSMVTIIQQNPRQAALKKSPSPSTCITNSNAASPRSGIVEPSFNPDSSYDAEFLKSKDFMDYNNFKIRLGNKNQTQENISLFECSICHGKYKSQLLLKHHFKRHVERKFLCDLCPKSFIVRTELHKHKLVHDYQATGEKPYKCDMCTKQFGYPHHLKRHKEGAHFGKRYKCTHVSCGKSFTTKAHVNIHRLSHTGNLPYKCKFCFRFFSKRESFRQHTQNVHKIKLTETEIAEVYRENMGHTNPHDLIVALDNGQMLRRSEAEAITSNSAKWQLSETV